MEKIIVKKKEYEILNQLGEHSCLVIRKNKKYFLKKFDDDNSFMKFMLVSKKIKGSGINNPKVVAYDKKNNYFLCEYLDGKLMINVLLETEYGEGIYDQLFQQFWYAKADHMGLDYHPDQWMLYQGKMYYLPFVYGEFAGKDMFLKNELKYWFYTKELHEYALLKGYKSDESRIGNEYEINRQITLMSVKYYR